MQRFDFLSHHDEVSQMQKNDVIMVLWITYLLDCKPSPTARRPWLHAAQNAVKYSVNRYTALVQRSRLVFLNAGRVSS